MYQQGRMTHGMRDSCRLSHKFTIKTQCYRKIIEILFTQKTYYATLYIDWVNERPFVIWSTWVWEGWCWTNVSITLNNSSPFDSFVCWQAFVSCTLGAQMVAGSLVGMALMQLIVSCTLSMLLRHVKRLAVLGTYFDITNTHLGFYNWKLFSLQFSFIFRSGGILLPGVFAVSFISLEAIAGR